MLALACAAAGLALARHYPLLPWAVLSAFIGLCGLAFVRPFAWPVALTALLPVAAFAPWTGWTAFEECDLLILAAATGGYARLAFDTARRRTVGGGPTLARPAASLR